MSTQDILNIFLIISLFIFITCVVFTTYYLIQALKAVTVLAEDLKNTTQGFKDKVSLKVLAAIPSVFVALLSKIIRRGR